MGDWGWGHLSEADKAAVVEGVADGGCHGGPFHAEIHLTDRCNVDCGFCCTRRLRGRAELSLAEITRIAEELKSLGCHSVTLSGGGEPLFHRRIIEALRSISSAGLAISQLTTNGTRLSPTVSRLLIDAGCEQVIVSLNGATPRDYAGLMGVSPRNFDAVIDNIRTLIAMRNEVSTARPTVFVQFLVHAGNIDRISEMYRTAVDLGVEKVIFNDISGPEWTIKPGSAEFAKQVEAYGRIRQDDRDRGIAMIHSHIVDIVPHLDAPAVRQTMPVRIGDAIRRFVGGERVAQSVAPTKPEVASPPAEITDCCLTPWHSITIRASGEVPVCCALQDRIVAQIGNGSVADVWHGYGLAGVRQQIRRSISDGESWQFNPERDTEIIGSCATNCPRDIRCRFRSFFFSGDAPFASRLSGVIDGLRRQPAVTSDC